jgi:ketosteroid isomerase-like protein
VSEANVEIVANAIQGSIDGDWPRAMEPLDEGVRVYPSRPTGVFKGPVGVKQAGLRWREMWTDSRIEIEELIDVGDQVIAVTHEHATSPRWGTAFERQVVQVWTLRDGKVMEIRDYADREEALAATGGREPAPGGADRGGTFRAPGT